MPAKHPNAGGEEAGYNLTCKRLVLLMGTPGLQDGYKIFTVHENVCRQYQTRKPLILFKKKNPLTFLVMIHLSATRRYLIWSPYMSGLFLN